MTSAGTTEDLQGLTGRILRGMRWLYLGLGLLGLFIGLSYVVIPILDMLPFAGGTQSGFFELWLIGLPVAWLSMKLVRRGLKKGGARVPNPYREAAR